MTRNKDFVRKWQGHLTRGCLPSKEAHSVLASVDSPSGIQMVALSPLEETNTQILKNSPRAQACLVDVEAESGKAEA